MAQPIWQTAAGSLGVIPEGVFYQQTLVATSSIPGPVIYSVIAGALPAGIQCTQTGQIVGVPTAATSLQGVPTSVNQDVTSKFVIRATANGRIADRTFELTVTGNDVPLFETPAGSIGTFYDGDLVNIQIQYTDDDPDDNVVVSLAAGSLPPGLSVSPTGLIYGYIRPATPIDQTPGYDETAADQEPYDFVVDFVSRNYQFTLEVNDGKSNDLRQFTMFVYSRNEITADTTQITADNNFVTADETNIRAPFLTNAEPSNLGRVRSDNYFSYRFIGEDYDNQDISYAIGVNTGFGLPPDIELDPTTGWLYGTILDQGTTEVEYSFNITVYQTQPVGPPVVCVTTTAGTNRIACIDVSSIRVGQPIKFTNTALGGVSTNANTLYYVLNIDELANSFTIAENPISTTPVTLTTSSATVVDDGNFVPGVNYVIVSVGTTTQSSWNTIAGTTNTSVSNLTPGLLYSITNLGTTSQSQWNNIANTDGITYQVGDTFVAVNTESGTGTVNVVWSAGSFFTASTSGSGIGNGDAAIVSSTLYANIVVTSEAYPFLLTIIGDIDSEITWFTNSDLGVIVNGETSLFKVEAVNRGGRALEYRLASGEFNSLPQGLELLPSGDIAGRVTFNTFAIDLGTTTFDSNETIWDSEFEFTVNAYAPDTQQLLYSVSEVKILNGGTGYSQIVLPVFSFSTPIGASAVQALVGNVVVDNSGAVTSIQVSNFGSSYTGNTGQPGAAVLTQISGSGSGLEVEVIMQVTGSRDVVSVFKTFTLRVIREYNAPYQNLYVQAMPPERDRLLIDSLLNNQEIFVPAYIYRPTDPNFGLSTRVTYQHAFGLAPDALDVYVESLYFNHYWKNLVLGSVETAQAIDSNGNVVYEVVYSRIIDNLVNAAGQSVAKIVPLPYPIPGPENSEIGVVYPNSLINMRDQVIDTVGQISTGLPLWMTSKQIDGRVLGFTPAWVIAYVNPGRGRQIAYYLQTQFGQQLNKIDFKVDRYILDRALSLNWDTTTQDWTPEPNLTTFDRFNTAGFNFIGEVSIATNLAYSDVNERTLEYISELGGLDGEILQINGDTIVFVKQEDYSATGGSSYSTVDAAWQEFVTVYDVPEEYDLDGFEYDESYTVSGGEEIECTETDATTDLVTYVNNTGATKVYPNLPITLSSPIGGLSAGLHVVLTTPSTTTFTLARAATVTNSESNTDLITISSATGFSIGSAVIFYPTTFGGLVAGTTYYILTINAITGGAQITVSLTPGGTRETLSSAAGSCIMRGAELSLTNDTGSMTAVTYNERMAIYQIAVDPITTVVRLSLVDQTSAGDFIQIIRGSRFRSAQLYRPVAPGQDLTRISWLPLPTVTTVETTFDQGSVEFIEPVDMYNPGEINDKYLVFPKTNILV